MAKKNLGTATAVDSMLHANSLLIEVGGSVRRITLEKFMDALNEGQSNLLREVAWGVPLKDAIQTSPNWGMVGNLAAYEAYKGRVGRYLMDASGKAAKLHKNNSGGYADGTALDESKGSVVVIGDRLYFLVQTDAETNIPYLWASEYPISHHYLANADNGRKMCIGAYKGSLSSGKLVSRSGVDCDTSQKNINAYWNAAQAFGKDWGLLDYDCWRWIAMMCLFETGGNANIQNGIGMGVGGSGIDWSVVMASSVLKKTGKTKSLGDSTGAIAISDSDAKVDSTNVSVCGIEDFWNLQFEFIQGVFCGSSDNSGQDGTEVFIYTGNRMPSTAEIASHPDGEFRQITRLTMSGYVGTMAKGEYFDLFATALGGDSNSKWSDYYYGALKGQVLLVGGGSYFGAYSGPFYASTNNAWSYASSSIGARPAYYGQITIVDGKNM